MIPLALVGDWTVRALVRILGFGLLAGVVTVLVAVVHRWYSRRRLAAGVGLLVGLSVPSAWLYVEAVTDGSLVSPTPLFHRASGAYVLGVFVAAAVASVVGRRIGDRIARDVYDIDDVNASGPAARLVRAGNLAVPVTLPDAIERLDGYEPVGEATRARLAGRTMLFPRRLAADELGDRLAERVREDFDVDHVHATVGPDGTVERFAVGTRPSGLSPRVPPGVGAVGIVADPPASVGAGDPVEIRDDRGDTTRPVATGSVRATDGDVTTVAVDADDASALDGDQYRLLVRPDGVDDARELAEHVWESDSTVTTVSVTAGSSMVGEFVGWLPGDVLLIEREEPIPFPDDSVTLQAGDSLYVLGTPSQHHRLADYDPDIDRTPPDDTPTA
ncbi:TrkA, K+ transport system, NAD-binding component [Halapricum desulfuricans]|uniref:TrkA, K+ transport system, NAD-binding component n=1 Tax=Halapricum desulfuricans TaxID=2841257 RepID=A0A897NJQ5_9EURY|nr:TrkA C-terminal domain-containing protein [Halapricum desulfuricans]QSG12878.1 TrkA, K+ transport system, NAD-binding component [Halapricum desulfuricans]